MKCYSLSVFLLGFSLLLSAQKKPLDHSVYNSWQSIGERMISNDGKWVVYTIDVQEGDDELVIQSPDAKYKKVIQRGYAALITEDSRFVIFKIKPLFSETREAKIKKKRLDDFPKDTLAIVELGKEEVWEKPRIKGFKTPQKSFGWLAYLSEKETDRISRLANAAKSNDSLLRVIDSLKIIISEIRSGDRKRNKDEAINEFADDDSTKSGVGTDLVLRNLITGNERVYKSVVDYYFSKNGVKLLMQVRSDPKDSLSKSFVVLLDLASEKLDTLSRGLNDFRNVAMTDDGLKIAYTAERDAKPKDLQKFYKLWYYTPGMDSAALLADRFSAGMRLGMTVSESGALNFSKNGRRLFFGTSPIQPPKDTTLVDMDLVKVDIWHYKDDYLQTVQLNRLQQDLRQSFLAVYDFSDNSIKQLGSKELPQIIQTNEGDGDTFIGVTDYSKRIESQWQGYTRKDVYAIDVNTGEKQLIKNDLYGNVYPSSTGKYILWYDREKKNYFSWDGKETKNITAKIKVPLYEEDFDMPDLPAPYGVMGWSKGDSAVFVYDRYDMWKVDPGNVIDPQNYLGRSSGRKDKTVSRYVSVDPEKKYIDLSQPISIKRFNELSKKSDYTIFNPSIRLARNLQDYSFSPLVSAKNKNVSIYTKENFTHSPDIYITVDTTTIFDDPTYGVSGVSIQDLKLSSLNPQQQNYLWGTAELFKWKAYNGKQATGIVYKPENFDPKKKYPLICYFYEKLSDNLNTYIPPAPIRSAINVSFFVSRGYMIFMPDIEYETGHPGRSAYNYIVSGARALVKKGWADSTRMAIQGHSWGGYQAAQLVTMTKLFKAAWAGAPVANMTSAYGGIRWESGLNRQFQYEKSQSRIGATLWEKPQLYIENSPLFHLKNVTTPLVIMHNDNDGAVPWYQGIELFTAMRRLGKKVWMFNYNGEGHGLTDRKDKLDYHIRMQQFFDWILKGESPAEWIIEGVPAVKKGKDWGLETGF